MVDEVAAATQSQSQPQPQPQPKSLWVVKRAMTVTLWSLRLSFQCCFCCYCRLFVVVIAVRLPSALIFSTYFVAAFQYQRLRQQTCIDSAFRLNQCMAPFFFLNGARTKMLASLLFSLLIIFMSSTPTRTHTFTFEKWNFKVEQATTTTGTYCWLWPRNLPRGSNKNEVTCRWPTAPAGVSPNPPHSPLPPFQAILFTRSCATVWQTVVGCRCCCCCCCLCCCWQSSAFRMLHYK